MAGNKRPAKRYRPRPNGVPNPLARLVVAAGAQSRANLNPGQLQQLGIFASGCWESLDKGRATEQDLATIGMAANLSIIFCEAGIGKEYRPDALAGAKAVGGVYERLQRTGKIGMDGQQRGDIAVMMDLHMQQLAHEDMTEGRLVAALQKFDALAAQQPDATYFYPLE